MRGYVHCHTSYSDGHASVQEMAREAAARGRDYITITDHSEAARYAGGLSPERLAAQGAEIGSVARDLPIRILHGAECDILKDGRLDYADEVRAGLDVVIASLHQRHGLAPDETTRRFVRALGQPGFKIWGHPLGRLLLRRPPVECDLEAVLDALAAGGGAVEINGDPHRLDLPPELADAVLQRGIPFVISTDAHAPQDLDFSRPASSWRAARASRPGTCSIRSMPTRSPNACVRRAERLTPRRRARPAGRRRATGKSAPP